MLDSLPAYRVAVIGAGVAGAACASRLAALPMISTTVFDMGSRGPGGRASSRPVDGKGGSFSPLDRGGASPELLSPDVQTLTFDHGVQAFVCTHPGVQELVDGWIENGHVSRWPGIFGVLDAATGRFSAGATVEDTYAFSLLDPEQPKYVGVPSMSAMVAGSLANAVASGADITPLVGCKVADVAFATEGESVSGARYAITSSDGTTRHFDAVVCAGHAASFAADVASRLPPDRADVSEPFSSDAEALAAVRRVSYPDGAAPLYALMVAFARPLNLRAPFDGAAVVGPSDLRWISRDSSKPGRVKTAPPEPAPQYPRWPCTAA